MQITREDAINAMSEAVHDKGFNYVYEPATCVYSTIENGEFTPSCLVGHALFNLGVNPEVIYELDSSGDTGINDEGPRTTLRAAGVNIEPDAFTAFVRAQHAQDNRETWGYALKDAMEAVNVSA